MHPVHRRRRLPPPGLASGGREGSRAGRWPQESFEDGLREDAGRDARRALHPDQRQDHRQGDDLRRDPHRADRARPQRQARRRRARLRLARRLSGGPSLLRGDRRPGRQPGRRREVLARRQGIHARRQQRAEHAPRRPERVRQGRLEGRGRLQLRRPRRQVHLPEPRRRGRFPRQPRRRRHLHRGRRQRAQARLQGHHRQGHAGRPDEPLLFQPRRPGLGHDPRPRDPDQRPGITRRATKG